MTKPILLCVTADRNNARGLLAAFRRVLRLLIVATTLGFVTGCAQKADPVVRIENRFSAATQAVLDSAEEVELLSISPDGTDPEGFHNWPITKTVKVTDPGTIRALIAAIANGVKESDGRPSACFEPRHGLRIKFGQQSVEMVICYECTTLIAYLDGERDENVRATTNSSAHFIEYHFGRPGQHA